jgi:tight adherence protein B
VAIGPALAVGAAPRAYYHRRRQQIGTERIAAWPDALRTVAAGLAARQTLHEALVGLATAGPPALRPVFERYRRLASSLDQRAALEAIRAELADPTSDRVIKVLIVAADEGATIVLDILNRQARDATLDVEVDERARSAQLEQRLNAWGVAVLPYVLLVMMCATWPDVRSFYRTPAGAVVVAVGLALSAGGVALVGRLGRQQGEERVFVVAAEAS